MIESALIDYLTIFFVVLLAIGLIIVSFFTSKPNRVSGYQPTIDTMNHEPPNGEIIIYVDKVNDFQTKYTPINILELDSNNEVFEHRIRYEIPLIKYPAINFKK